jgi:hypothetical protein
MSEVVYDNLKKLNLFTTRDLGFIYVSPEGRVGCEFIHPAQAEEALGPISIPRVSRGVVKVWGLVCYGTG